MPKVRIENIDIFRGIGLVLMVMGHLNFGDEFYKLIYGFHMPMFFFISGYCFYDRGEKWKKTLHKKAKSLLVPYFIFGISEYILWLFFELSSGKSMRNMLLPLGHLVYKNTEGLAIAGAIWFLTALFFVDMAYLWLSRNITRKYILNIVIVIFAVFGCYYTKLFSGRLPWALDAACAGIGFYHIGVLLKEFGSGKDWIEKILNMKPWLWCVLTVIDAVLILYNDRVNMRTGRYAFIPLTWFNAVLAILLLWNLSLYIWRGKKNARVVLWISKYLKEVGSNGMTYVCLNQLTITCVVRVLTHFLPVDDKSLLFNVVTLFIVLSGLYIANLILCKTKLRVLVGKEQTGAAV